ncbi:hypothetical protein L6452_16218 [Arctium lappa]|uniref:Uncharacterized protein n=1 Tax=Arctium lappa TaxID=4217 RepID=A0ACB9C052_ARCLA|nr:hypothetical protein L6452_16218 [Arctium lappa]
MKDNLTGHSGQLRTNVRFLSHLPVSSSSFSICYILALYVVVMILFLYRIASGGAANASAIAAAADDVDVLSGRDNGTSYVNGDPAGG